MKFKGVIFDLDGTLVNSLEDIADSMNRVLVSRGMPRHTYDTYRYLVGSGIRNLVAGALPEQERSEQSILACHEAMVADYRDNCLVKTNLYDGVADLLEWLKKYNIPMGVYSNKREELTKMICAALFESGLFQIILGARPGLPKKPDPAGALMVAEHLGQPPENLLFVGDTNIDMQTAISANMYAVGVTWGFRPREELIEAGAKTIINHPSEILDFFPL